jgi:hypothetical protein
MVANAIQFIDLGKKMNHHKDDPSVDDTNDCCEHCKGNGPYCEKMKPDGIFECTKPIGHTGPHVACGTDNHQLDVWPQTSTKNKLV